MIVFPDYGDPCPLSGCYSVSPIISAPILSGFGCSSFPHGFVPIKNAIGTTHGSRTDGVVAIRMPIGAGYQPGIGALGLRHPKFHISLAIATTLWVETGQKDRTHRDQRPRHQRGDMTAPRHIDHSKMN
jgi:hypothetical protein